MPGSPPRARGAPVDSADYRPPVGITPACAGSTVVRRGWCLPSRDHPRVRGEHLGGRAAIDALRGSPPRARGAHLLASVRRREHRITPACAGSTSMSRTHARPGADHPRVRGEHYVMPRTDNGGMGSPPRARGAHLPTRDVMSRSGGSASLRRGRRVPMAHRSCANRAPARCGPRRP